ncbi:MAG: exodeoxyribonuclease III [Anaerolineales bacterium]|nr:exodeoxyribonuclease III [Anaerolineales bacterium]
MRIVTWNVNGIRAALGKGALEWMRDHGGDVLCLQEVRAAQEQVEKTDLERLTQAYPHVTWNAAQRGGYSGVATLARRSPQETRLGMGVAEFDVEGRLICTRHPGFLLFNIYFPNGGRDHERVPFKLDFYARLLALCDELHAQGEQIVLCGDFNTSHQEIDLRNPRENENTTGFLPEERAWIDRYLAHGFVDAYRRLYPERVQYTWWTYRFSARTRNIGWRLDYFLVSEGLMQQVQDVVVHEEIMGSDHCPVSLSIAEPSVGG